MATIDYPQSTSAYVVQDTRNATASTSITTNGYEFNYIIVDSYCDDPYYPIEQHSSSPTISERVVQRIRRRYHDYVINKNKRANKVTLDSRRLMQRYNKDHRTNKRKAVIARIARNNAKSTKC